MSDMTETMAEHHRLMVATDQLLTRDEARSTLAAKWLELTRAEWDAFVESELNELREGIDDDNYHATGGW